MKVLCKKIHLKDESGNHDFEFCIFKDFTRLIIKDDVQNTIFSSNILDRFEINLENPIESVMDFIRLFASRISNKKSIPRNVSYMGYIIIEDDKLYIDNHEIL
jgi:hypothetical protein